MAEILKYQAQELRSDAKEIANGKDVFWLKNGIWLYLLLLFFEGALRKWVLPTLSGPLLVVRDPIAIILLGWAIYKGYMPKTLYVFWMIGVSIISFFTALLLGHGSLVVALYGLRITLIHFPIMFLIGKILNEKDVIHMGIAIMWIAIPMTVLMILQFYSPQSAWVNRGIGGDIEGGGFSGAMGYFRPPTTFSFISGTVAFYSLLCCFVMFFWLDKAKHVHSALLVVATFCLIIAIPLSISRTLFFQVIVTVLFAMLSLATNPRFFVTLLLATSAIAVVFFILSSFSFFQESILVFTNRFESANNTEGGLEGVLVDRFLGGMYGALFQADELPYFGHGVGMGTNAGAQLLTGKVGFLISEGEWGRVIGEQGALLGLTVIGIRTFLGIQLLWEAFKTINKGKMLAWLILSFGFLKLLQGQWAQPTELGFAVISVGFAIALLKVRATTSTKILWK